MWSALGVGIGTVNLELSWRRSMIKMVTLEWQLKVRVRLLGLGQKGSTLAESSCLGRIKIS